MNIPRLYTLILSLLISGLVSCSEYQPDVAKDWRTVLEKPEISQEEFLQAYVDALVEKYPSAQV